ncbi:MAG: hypothetical protein QXN55_09275 [Candidatus Nitrosotenuis sp.]
MAATLMGEDYFTHDAGYYVGSFLASATIGVILTVIAIMLLRKMNNVSD